MGKIHKSIRMDSALNAELLARSVPPYSQSWHIETALKKHFGMDKQAKAKPTKRFTKPTQVELYDYFTSQGLGITEAGQEAQKFLDYYDSNYWKVGQNKMKDWKATVRTWINRSKTNGNKQRNLSAVDRVKQACGRDEGSLGTNDRDLRGEVLQPVRGESQRKLDSPIDGVFTRED